MNNLACPKYSFLLQNAVLFHDILENVFENSLRILFLVVTCAILPFCHLFLDISQISCLILAACKSSSFCKHFVSFFCRLFLALCTMIKCTILLKNITNNIPILANGLLHPLNTHGFILSQKVRASSCRVLGAGIDGAGTLGRWSVLGNVLSMLTISKQLLIYLS